MENIKFTSKQIAAWKRTAMNVNPLVTKIEKLKSKMDELQTEINKIQTEIDLNEAPVKFATNGYTTSDIFKKVVTDTGKVTKDGIPIKNTTYELKYPETIIPMQEVEENTSVDTDECKPNESTEEVSYTEQ